MSSGPSKKCPSSPSDDRRSANSFTQLPESKEALYEHIFDHLSTGVALLQYVPETDGQPDDLEVLLVNNKVSEYAGFPVEYLRHQRLRSLYTHEVQQKLLNQLIHCVKTARRTEIEEQSPRTGQWYHMGVTPIAADQLIVTFNDVTALKEAEIRQNKLTQTLQDIFDGSLTGIAQFIALRDGSGRVADFLYIMTNQANASAVGLNKEDIIGHTIIELFPEVRTNGLLDRMIRTVETEESQRFEMHYQNGQFDSWVDMLLTKLDDGILLTYLDTTEKKGAEISRQRQNDLLKTIVENTPAGKVLFESLRGESGQIVDFRYVMTNQTNARTIGRTVAEIEGRTLLELFPGTKPTGFFDRLVQTVETGETQRFQMHYTEDGMDIWLDAYTVKQGDGLLYTFLDISDIKRLQQQQQQQAELFETVLDSMLHSIAVYEAIRDENGEVADFRITMLNRNAVESLPAQYQLQRAGIVGNTILSLYPNSREQGIFNRMVEVLKTNVSQRFYHDYPEFGISYDYSMRKFGDGIILGMVDITPIRKYQLELEHRNHELKRSNDHLQQFAYVASHDLQEPLRKIQAFSDILVQSYPEQLGEQGIDMLQRMQGASERMSTLIQDLLIYSRVSTQFEPFQTVDLQNIIDGVLTDLEMTVQEKKARIQIGSLPRINGNALQLRQLFQNLLANALKFTPAGTAPVVRIESRSVPGHQITDLPSVSQKKTYHEISIQDNGIGFDEKYSERIFQVFQRLHGRHQYNGTGIGLAICKKVVENHNGTITARSRPGEGAMFSIYLPA